jgi:hypothetical protein
MTTVTRLLRELPPAALFIWASLRRIVKVLWKKMKIARSVDWIEIYMYEQNNAAARTDAIEN